MSKVRNLITYITNPFRKAFSLARMVAYTTDSIQRMIAHNADGVFTARITATATALSNLMNSRSSDEIKLGIRAGVKLAKDNFRNELPDAIRPIYGAVLTAFNEPSVEMKNVFPKKRKIFSIERDDDLLIHLNTMVEGLTALQSSLGVPIVDEATALRDQWVTIHQASEAASGEKALAEAEKRSARESLAHELFLNLNYIGTLITDEPDKLGLYMQQSLLGGPTTETTPGGVPAPGSQGSTGSTSTSMSSVGSVGSGSSISSSTSSTSMVASSSGSSSAGSSSSSTSSTGSSSGS